MVEETGQMVGRRMTRLVIELGVAVIDQPASYLILPEDLGLSLPGGGVTAQRDQPGDDLPGDGGRVAAVVDNDGPGRVQSYMEVVPLLPRDFTPGLITVTQLEGIYSWVRNGAAM